MVDQMHRTCVKFPRYLSPLPSLPSLPVLAVSIAFSQVAIIDVEVFKTNTSFLTLFLGFENICWSNNPFFIVEAFDLEDVFPFFLDDIGVSTYYIEVMATTLSLLLKASKTSLVTLVFLASFALVGQKLLEILAIGYVNGKSINGLIPFWVFFLFFCRPIPVEILGVNLASTWGWL